MAKETIEDYRLSIRLNGVRRKLVRHSVEEDETLLVQVRSAPRPTSVGTVEWRNGDVETSEAQTARRAVSFHPSGRINTKGHDGRHVDILTGPPLSLIKAPILLLVHSAASFDQFDADNSKMRHGDHCIELDNVGLRRIHLECLIGPKGAFNGELQWPFGWAVRIVYEDAAFYDVCYVVGEAPPIPDHLESNGIKINRTVLTATLNQSQLSVIDIDAARTAPEAWASPPAVARQLRALFEHRYEQLRRALHVPSGSYHIKMTMTSEGVVAAIEPLADGHMPSASWQTLLTLDVDGVLQVVSQTNDTVGLVDAYELDPILTNGVEKAVYLNSHEGRPRYPLVFAARQLLKNRYFRILPDALKNIDSVLDRLEKR